MGMDMDVDMDTDTDTDLDTDMYPDVSLRILKSKGKFVDSSLQI